MVMNQWFTEAEQYRAPRNARIWLLQIRQELRDLQQRQVAQTTVSKYTKNYNTTLV